MLKALTGMKELLTYLIALAIRLNDAKYQRLSAKESRVRELARIDAERAEADAREAAMRIWEAKHKRIEAIAVKQVAVSGKLDGKINKLNDDRTQLELL